jgi:hypothetical protein
LGHGENKTCCIWIAWRESELFLGHGENKTCCIWIARRESELFLDSMERIRAVSE